MANTPDSEIVEKYADPVGRVSRRIAIYESDGQTPWAPFDSQSAYLIDGSVSVDYERDERRTLDLTLDNDSGVFETNVNGFWYDKVIKVFRGLEINQPVGNPRIAVIRDSENEFADMRAALATIGFTDLRYFTTAATLADIEDYDIIISNDGTSAPSKASLINDALFAGMRILTIGVSSSPYTQLFSTTETFTGAGVWNRYNAEMTGITGWTSVSATAASWRFPTGLLGGVYRFATRNTGAPFNAMGIALAASTGAKWVHLSAAGLIGTASGFDKLFTAALRWLNPKPAIDRYEIQVGEFMIDSISEAHFPHHTKVQGRDYTKKLILSKFTTGTQFIATDKVETVIKSIAINGGVSPTRILLPSALTNLGKAFLFERGTDRWTAIKEMATAFNYEVFFDNFGNFVLRQFQDPTTSPPVYDFYTQQTADELAEIGLEGDAIQPTLVSYERSANDQSIFNHIVVTGESSDSTVVPVSAEAKNTDTGTTTYIAKIGDRTYLYTSPLITTQAQAQALADQYLKLYALEEFSINWESICIDWLEAGDVVSIHPDDISSYNPTTFLMTSFTIPLTLAPMSGTGRRMLKLF